MKSQAKLLSLIALALVISACDPAPEATEDTSATTNEQMEVVPTTATETTPMATDETTMMESTDEEVDVTIETSNFKFSQDTITAAPGETIKVKVVNQQGMHDFVIDELDVATSQMTEAGQEETVEITIPETAEAGDTYEYYCSVGQHRQMGMVGTLTVE